MKKISAVLIGAGMRGMFAYAPYALNFPNELEFVAVAEPDLERRELFSRTYNISKEMCFSTWEDLLSKGKIADVAIIATQDNMHFEPAMEALKVGYHLLLEKPMSNNPAECVAMEMQAAKYSRLFYICHVLRYTPFFRALKQLLNENKIGELVSIQHNENVGYYHQVHSYVRGNWRNSKEASPMILAKSCHDLDILLWLANSDCKKLSSFGSLKHFKAENTPSGAPDRCTDGCPVRNDCPYNAMKLYSFNDGKWQTGVLRKAVCMENTQESLIKALQTGPYGRCVYKCDNDVVDHQVVNIEFENGVTASFTMCAFTHEISRTIKLMGTMGEIRGHMEKNEIELINFITGDRQVIKLNASELGHGGGDEGIMREFVRNVNDSEKIGLTSINVSVQSHLMAFAAEESRLHNKVIDIKNYADSFRKATP